VRSSAATISASIECPSHPADATAADFHMYGRLFVMRFFSGVYIHFHVVNLDITGEEDEAELFRMIAAAAAAQGIPLQWILSSQGQGHDGDDDEDEEESEPIEYPFDQLPKSLSELAEFIQSDKCRNILILAGAGMSVAGGIPDFRSSDGLYATMNADTLTCTNPAQREAIRQDPSTALDQHLFLENPLPCLESQREFILGTRAQRWKATLAHRFVELLHCKTSKLVRLYTQNIDGLEDQCTQLPPDKVIAVHGSMDRAECARCGSPMDFGQFCSSVQTQIKDLTGQDTSAPTESTPITCPVCSYNAVKPAIVLFRSNLPKQFFENVPNDVKEVDLLLIFGTSLKVAPANSLVWRVPKSAMRVLVNREIVGEHLGLNLHEEDQDHDDHDNSNDDDDNQADSNANAKTDKHTQHGEAALGDAAAAAVPVRRMPKKRDFFAEGDCDEVLLDLMMALGWSNDLKPLLSLRALPAPSEALLRKRLEEDHSRHKTTSHGMKSDQQQPPESKGMNDLCK
jgi:NAD-dependent SIR2 family protein deacetylase